MNLTITPVHYAKSTPAFKGYSGDCGDDDKQCYSSYDRDDDDKVSYSTYEEDLKRGTQNGFRQGVIAGGIGTFLFATFIVAADVQNNNKENARFLNKVANIAASDSIRQDTFTVKDVNKDENPDLILYKKDGSKVIIDITNKKVTNSKKLDVIK